ncbi:MAG: DUF11 domain-containing protein [Anaerolineae bacterium]|nr:DUF11 domain-containing protein [Anaerolineae bacterium]
MVRSLLIRFLVVQLVFPFWAFSLGQILPAGAKESPAVSLATSLPAWFSSNLEADYVIDRGLSEMISSLDVKPAAQSSKQTADTETLTSDEGRYVFAGLSHGTHKITLDPTTLPLHLQPADGETVPVLWINPGQTLTSEPLVSGVRLTAKYDSESGDISGVVFVDVDGDGQQSEVEAGLAGIRVIDPTSHQYFVPFSDLDLWTLFFEKDQCHTGNPTPALPLISYVFLTSGSDGTVYYYDHWEDGYDADPLNPGSTTELGIVDTGVTKIFQSDIFTSQVGSTVTLYYDGRDRITLVGESAAVVRLAYPATPGVRLAAAWEVPEAADWGTEYVATVGQDLDFNGAGWVDDHDYTGLEVMAWQPGTEIYYNGSLLPGTFGPGDVYFMDGGVNSDDVITSTAPIQVQMMTGACGGVFSAHGYTLQPVDVWDDAYWAPVPGFEATCGQPRHSLNADTDIYVHNHHTYAISITIVSNSNIVSITVQPMSTASVLDSTGWADLGGGNFGTSLFSDDVFWGVVVIDSSTNQSSFSEDFDWGYSLIPESRLSSQVIVGYAPGNDDVPGNPANGNIAFVTAVTDTIIYVDLNQDGLPDPFDMDGDGDILTVDVFAVPEWDEPLSALGVPLLAGQVLRVGDPVDSELTGAIIYTIDMSDRIVVAWGQDPCRANNLSPFLDLGYTILPSPIPSLAKISELAVDADLTGNVSPGDTITYTLVLYNNGLGSLNNMVLTDTLPYTYTSFVVGSFQVTTPPSLVEYNDGSGWSTTATSDAHAFRIGWDTIGPRQTVTMTFLVKLDDDIPVTVTQVTNQAVASSDETPPRQSEDPNDPFDPDTDTDIGHPLLTIEKRVVPSTIRPDGVVTYTVVVSNVGSGVALDVVLSDVLPSGLDYVPGTLNMTWPVAVVEVVSRVVTHTSNFQGYYADDFDLDAVQSTGYTGTDGTLDWSTDWIEILDDGNSGTGAVQVETEPANTINPPAYLLIQYPGGAGDVGLQRTVDLGQFISPTLRYYISGTIDSDTTDFYSVRAPGGFVFRGEYNGPYTLREHDLALAAGYVVAPLVLTVTGALDTGESYRLDNMAIYESSPERVVTKTLIWESTVLTYVTSVGGDPVYGPVNGLMVITQGLRMPPGSVLTVTFQARATIPLTNGLILTNTACFSSTNADAGCSEAPIQILSSHVLTITKTDMPDPVVPGSLLTYTLAYVAEGDGPAPNVIITDLVQAQGTFFAAYGGLRIDAPPVGGTGIVTWHLGTLLAAGSGITYQTGVVTLVIRVDPSLTVGPILNTAYISDDSGVSDQDDEPTDIDPPQADVLIAKSDSPDPAIAGGTLFYTLVYTNAGPSDAQEVYITDTLPLSVTYGGVVSQPPGWSNPPVYYAGPPATLSWYTPTLAAGASGRFVFTVTVGIDVSDVITNSVTITSTTPDPDRDNNRDDEPTAPPVPGITVIKSVRPARAAHGQTVTYTLVVSNSGGIMLNAVALTDTLPPELLYNDHAVPAEPDSIMGQTQVWNDITGGAGLAPRASLTITFRVVVDVGTGITGTYTNTVIGAGEYPGGVVTDTDDAVVEVAVPRVDLIKSLATSVYDPNIGLVTFTIVVINNGPSALDVLPLSDDYDQSYLSFISADPMPNEPADDGRLDWYDLTASVNGFDSNLAPGEQFTITTVFAVIRDIDRTTNVAAVSDVIDEYGNPANDAEDNEVIVDARTSVELVYFEATRLFDAVLLEWATAAEVDNYGFYLLRSTDQVLAHGVTIAFIPAAGYKRGGGATYRFKDMSAQSGVWYTYWLVDVNTNGQRTVHGSLSVSLAELPYRIFMPIISRLR